MFSNSKLAIRWIALFLLVAAVLVINLQPAGATYPGKNGKIVFIRRMNAHTDREVFTMNADGSDLTRLTTDTLIDASPVFSPNGSKIAFNVHGAVPGDIMIMNVDGSGRFNVTNRSYNDHSPDWSSDGTKLVFDGWTGTSNIDVYIINSDGTNRTQLTSNSAQDQNATFSPDGSKISFVSYRDGNAEIYVMDADGTNQNRLTNNSANDDRPRWSPDGNKITYQSDRDGDYEIYIMNADGSSPANISASPTSNEFHPDISPDGTKIVFNSDRDGQHEIYIMDVDGSNIVKPRNDTPVYDSEPRWQRLSSIDLSVDTDLFCTDESATLTVDISDVTDLYGYQFVVNYDQSVVSASGSFVNSFFDTTNDATVPGGWGGTCAAGECKFAAIKIDPGLPVSGSGAVATVAFTPIQPGTFDVTISQNVLSDVQADDIAHITDTQSMTVCGYASVSGKVKLQGRPSPVDSGTVTLTDTGRVFGPYSTNFSAADGSYTINNIKVMPGGSAYQYDAAHGLYLGNQLLYTLNPSDAHTPARTRLRGGDADNSSNIDMVDIVCIATDFGGPPNPCGATGSSDINADSTVNIRDLVMSGINYGRSTPQGW